MISYTITVCNEHNQLNTLLNYLSSKISKHDEIVLQMDSLSVTNEVREVVEEYKGKIQNLIVIEFPLNNDFSSFKNNLKKHCTKKWIFNIDADEIPAENLMIDIHEILKENQEVDMFLIPRWNTVDGITEDHIKQWNWNYDKEGRVNWPDLQTRIYKNNESIVWKNKVHERLSGFTTYAVLPEEIEYCLFHHKTIERQEKQNEFYSQI
jgi:hypothetical protein